MAEGVGEAMNRGEICKTFTARTLTAARKAAIDYVESVRTGAAAVGRPITSVTIECPSRVAKRVNAVLIWSELPGAL